ncbi:carboxypeptidase regulatory-like domain-containing protein [Thermodesulfobacteriota bacterium]
MKKIIFYLCFSILFVLSISISSAIAANDYYVDASSGDNISGDGSQGNPWMTISYALAQVTGPEVTIHVAPGVYDTVMDGTWYEVFPIYLKDGVSIEGEDKNTTIIDAGLTAVVFIGLDITSETFISNLTIRNGKNTSGSSHNDGNITLHNADIIIENNIIEGGQVQYYGAGILCIGSSPSILNNEFINNVGSTILVTNFNYDGTSFPVDSSPLISGNIFRNNSGGSGAIYIDAWIYTGSPVIINNNITGTNGNGITVGGGAEYGGTIFDTKIYNNTISNNSQDGISLEKFYNGSVEIVNNIIANNGNFGINETDENGSESDPILVQYNLFNNNTAGHYLDERTSTYSSVILLDALVSECSNNLEGDPLFVDPSGGDYHLQAGSPGINTGETTTEVITDIDGDSRPQNSAYDIGADEHLPGPVGNNAPYTPTLPYPADNANGISAESSLSWSGGDPDAEDSVTYDVYFGTSYTPSLAAIEQSSTTYDPGILGSDTVYYWKIISKDNYGAQTVGPIWSFKTLDTTPPSPPNVSGDSPTFDLTPTWSWTTGGGGNGTYRYKLDNSDLSSGATETTDTFFTPESDLSEGSHTLYVQERDDAGNWSDSGSFIILIELRPDPPDVSGVSLTDDSTPTWSWTSGGGGNGTYRYKLDDSDLSSGATETTDTTYTPGSVLPEGSYILYLQERDDDGDWSISGSFTVVIDATPGAVTIVDSFDVPGSSPRGLVWGDSSLWMVDKLNKLYQLDENGIILSGPISLDFTAYDLEWDGGNLWVGDDTNRRLAQIDMSDGSTVSTLYHGYYQAGFTWDGAYWWINDYDIYKYNAVGEEILSFAAPFACSPTGMTFDGNNLWVADDAFPYNQIYRLTLQGVQLSYIDLDVLGLDPVGTTAYRSIAWDGKYLWFSSNDLFSVYKLQIDNIQVTAPNGGEEWIEDNTYDITWTAFDDHIQTDNVKIEFSTDGGSTWTTIVESTENDGSYSWALGDISVGNNYIVKVSDAADGFPFDISNDFFTVEGNQTPYTPSSPSPANSASEISEEGDLSWAGGDPDPEDTVTYDLYFGTSETPPLVATDHTSTTYNSGIFQPDTTYYWKIVARDNHGDEAVGAIWSFITNVDSDSDEMMDSWEIEHFGDLATSDGNADSDTDGLTDLEEYNNGSNPTVPDYDIVAPSVIISNPTDGSSTNQLYIIEGSASDELSGVSTIEVSITDGTWYWVGGQYPWTDEETWLTASGTESWSLNTSGVTWTLDTVYTINVLATDNDGNSSVTSISITFTNRESVYTNLSIDLSSQTILNNGTIDITGQLTEYSEPGLFRSGLDISITVTDPDGITNAYSAITYDYLGHYILEDLAGFTKKGLYQVQVSFEGTALFNASDSEVKTVLVGSSAGYAVIVEGKIENEEGILSHNKTTNRIYTRLKDRGFVDENIYYFNYDDAQVGVDVDAIPSKSGIQNAIEVWALEKMNGSPAPLWIIMVDHGDTDVFYIDNETITPNDLDLWLTNLEINLSDIAYAEKRIVIIGACHSGSFIPDLSSSGRIIISSSAEDEASYKGPKETPLQGEPPEGIRSGEFFMEEFFLELKKGESIRAAFENATEKTEQFTRRGGDSANTNQFPYFDDAVQHPLLEDDGEEPLGSNILYDGEGDGYLSRDIYLGVGLDYDVNSAENPAEVLYVTETIFLGTGESSASMWAKINDDTQASSVWMEIRSPDMTLSDSSSPSQLILDIPKEFMLLDETLWEKTYNLFDSAGMYEIFYYASDGETGEVSPMKRSIVYKALAENNPPESCSLLNPPDGDEVETSIPLLWNSSIDPDNDPVTYTVEISKYDNFSVIDHRAEGLRETYYFVGEEAELNDLTRYYWRVSAVDQYGSKSINNTVCYFDTDNTNGIPGFFIGSVFTEMGAGIAGAIIEAGDNSTTTLNNGTFQMPLPSGSHDIVVTAEGFESQTETVTVTAEDFANQDFILSSSDGDSDNDGTPDYEDECPSDPNKITPGECGCWIADTDSDGDGIADCNDNYPDDYDNDGMPDEWEEQNGLDPLVNDADEDNDADGYTNLTEYRRGTDPQDAESYPSKGLPWLMLLLGEE